MAGHLLASLYELPMVADPDLPQGGRFEGGTHRYPLRVFFEDTDAGSVVYHASYLRFMERARSDMLRVAGIDQAAALAAGDGGYAVIEAAVRFRRPARLEDALVVASRVAGLRNASCLIHQRVMRGAELLVEAEIRVAFVRGGRPVRQPAAWLDIFRRIEGLG